MIYLVYINGLGPNYKGDNIYEFIFSDTLDVFGENWDSKPANGYPLPPDIEYIKKVGTLLCLKPVNQVANSPGTTRQIKRLVSLLT